VIRRQTRKQLNGIERSWSNTKPIPDHDRGVSKYYFPIYLKEIEYRFNHTSENHFK